MAKQVVKIDRMFTKAHPLGMPSADWAHNEIIDQLKGYFFIKFSQFKAVIRWRFRQCFHNIMEPDFAVFERNSLDKYAVPFFVVEVSTHSEVYKDKKRIWRMFHDERYINTPSTPTRTKIKEAFIFDYEHQIWHRYDGKDWILTSISKYFDIDLNTQITTEIKKLIKEHNTEVAEEKANQKLKSIRLTRNHTKAIK